MQAEWDESYFGAQQEDPSTYWVCFWTTDDIEHAATHDPHRITGARSIEEVLDWVHEVKGERRFELFVETLDPSETRTDGWSDYRKLVRLGGDFRPGNLTSTLTASEN
ncbi:hypothetical protein [Frigoribacterium salinisoli]